MALDPGNDKGWKELNPDKGGCLSLLLASLVPVLGLVLVGLM